MATLKYVYFCESDPSKWFENQKDAERYDKAKEVEDWVRAEYNLELPLISKVIDRIMKRYDITEYYDYVKPAEDVQE